MRLFFKIITESIRQALQQLAGNKLRTFLSLLGISIGILCIVGVLSAVTSLQRNVEGSLSKLGDDVVYVDKWPWRDVSDSWWDYFQRPHPNFADYEAVKERVQTASIVCHWTVPGSRTLEYESNNVQGAVLLAATPELDRVFNIEIDRGRFLSPAEYYTGADKMMLGHKVAQELFGALNPIGKEIKMQGRRFEVIGTLAASGDELINPLDFDDVALVGYNNASRFINLRTSNRWGGTLAVKAKPGIELEQLQDDIRGTIRRERRLRPKEEDDFSMNQMSMVADQLEGFFGALRGVGFIIGFLSILVGGVSVANIMFVSVKERTSLIGVKKALGAKKYVILLEFLIESVLLCLVGGLIGLGLVFLITAAISQAIPFNITLDFGNAMIGIGLSALIGIVAGMVPALLAARLDPVEAMRS
ncbi:MAG: ABC transporter permease [Bacteroidota bacterium]